VKKEYILLAVAIVALVLYLVLRNGDRTHYELPEIEKPGRDAITLIDISGPSGTLELKRFDEVWKSQPEGYPLDKTKIDGMLDALSGLDIVSLVSESGNYPQYDLGEEKRVKVEAKGGGGESLLGLSVGKAASTYRHTYVKLSGDDRVYQVSGNIRRIFDVEIDKLRDRKVLSIDRNAVTGLMLSTDSGSLSLTKVASPPADSIAPAQTGAPAASWMTPDSTEADTRVVDGIISRVANLQCDGFPEPDAAAGAGEPEVTAVFTGASIDTLRIYGDIGDKKYLATSSQYDFPFLLSEWKVKQIGKTPSELMGTKDEEQ
jgi:hypothetical protein